MEITKQVVSLELAKKLKGLGVEQESLFIWSEHTKPETLWSVATYEEKYDHTPTYPTYSAFTVAELLQMLKEPVLVPVDGSAADYLAGLIINMHKNGERV